MAESIIGTTQSITKDSVVGDRLMNRYAVFNGLERPRRIDSGGNYQILGVDAAPTPSAVAFVNVAGAGLVNGRWYAWVAVYASTIYTRPVPVLDATGAATRGNPSATPLSAQATDNAADLTIPTTSQSGITHVFLYRSLGASTRLEAETGPFYYVGQALNAGAAVTIRDTTADDYVGVVAETDNYPPNAYRYAVAAQSYVFAGGRYLIGNVAICSVEVGSPLVTVSGELLYDGIIGWRFRVSGDNSGGADQGGLYFANYVNATTLQLVDGNNDPINYNGTNAGTAQQFTLYLPGNLLRWSKKGEPESWPTENSILFEGDITGIAQLPNQPLLLVCTDEPSMYTLDLNIIGTSSFKTNKYLLSNQYTASSHWSLCGVEGRMRAIDAHQKAIIETDGTSVRDITSDAVPLIWDYLSKDINDIKLWHCAYDKVHEIFGAFVTFKGSVRMIDFSINQHLTTGEWFFNFEKDLLCTGLYKMDPVTGETFILGGTEGPGSGRGGIWGRIWTPTVYDEWIPTGCLKYGTVVSATANSITVDVSGGTEFTTLGAGLTGRWALITNPDGEYAQLGYITSNTADTLNFGNFTGGLDSAQFSPQPGVGWKFWLGMIECRWGPKRYDFGDPDVLKKVWEVWCTMSGHDEDKPPVIRLYRGFETGYDSQLKLREAVYLDRTKDQSFRNKVDNKLEAVPRWSVAIYERSHEPTTLHSITIVFSKCQ